MQLLSVRNIALAFLAATVLLPGQSRPTPPVTQVMAILTVRDGVDREHLVRTMPEEVRATVRLYLDGRIQQWFARGDGKGVVFFLNAKTAEEAKAITGSLPLIQQDMASFEYMPVGPLSPLRYLMEAPVR